MALYEGTKEHAYQLTLCVLTSLYSDLIKLVHFDGELLHIFMHAKFRGNEKAIISRIFDARVWQPDAILHDILSTEQAFFSIRERRDNDVVESSYRGLKSYEGPVDYTEIREQLIAADVTDLTSCALVYTVDSIEETVYHDHNDVADIQARFIGGAGERLLDTWVMAKDMRVDKLLMKQAVLAAERYFKRANIATPRHKLKPTTQQKLDKSRIEARGANKVVKADKAAKRAARKAAAKAGDEHGQEAVQGSDKESQ